MPRICRVAIDHSSIYCTDIQLVRRTFEALGFYSQNGLHYIFDGNYIEGYQLKPGDGPYDFVNSPGAVNALIFWSSDADSDGKRLEENGIELQFPIGEYSRPAEYQGKTEAAVFRGSYIKTPILPLGETAFVQHKTPHLIYQAEQMEHPNTVSTISEIFICVPRQEDIEPTARRFDQITGLLEGGEQRRCIHRLSVAGAEEYQQRFGVTVDPARSGCTGYRFLTKELQKLEGFVKNSNFAYHWKDQSLCVDVSKELNLFFVFDSKQ
jgi:hypothetical protein